MHLQIISPEALIVDGEVQEVQVKTIEGSMGILDHHTAFMANLVPTTLRYRILGEWHELPASAGILEIQHNSVLILLDE